MGGSEALRSATIKILALHGRMKALSHHTDSKVASLSQCLLEAWSKG